MFKIGKLLLLLLLFMTTLYAKNDTSSQVESTSKTQAKDLYVKVSNITEHSTKVMSILKDMEALLQESESVKDLQLNINPYCESIDVLLENDNYRNIEQQNVRELQKMRGELSGYIKQLVAWDELVKENVKKYDENRKILKNEIKIWQKTDENARKENAPETILDHIDSVIKDTQTLEKLFKDKYDRSLVNAQLLTSHIFRLRELSETLKVTEQIASNKVFTQNKAPLLTLLLNEEFQLNEYVKNIFQVIDEKYNESKEYFFTNSDLWFKFFIAGLVALVFTVYYNTLYRKQELFVRKDSLEKKIFFFIGRPFTTFTILLVLALVAVFPDRPGSVAGFISIVLVLPVIRILETVIKPEYIKYLYIFFLAYIAFWFNKNSIGFDVESRVFTLLVNLTLLVYTLRLVYKKIPSRLYESKYKKITTYLMLFVSLLFVIAIGTNLYGSVLLSNRLIESIFTIYFSALIFSVLYIILTGYIVLILRRRIATASNMLEIYSVKIESITKKLIKVWMFSWWLLVVAKTISLYPFLIEIKESVLSFTFHISQTTISVQGIVDFILIVIGTWILARLTRIVLEVEVFSRFKLPRGAPTAILTTLNYIIIITGTIIAFSSLGVTPQQFALVFGALGVGIGFGLRNIIANFVSGIIMVFERPIQIGDTIEVDKTMGSVQSIGARSSTVKTFDGSEVIIPNADFIAKEIINWTLSDEHRRKTVEFKVDLDNDIETILKIMKDVAVAHPDVLSDPEPLATFKHFGEYYLEFKLYFWLSDNLIVAHSDVTIGIYKALKDAGVKMPVKTFKSHPEL